MSIIQSKNDFIKLIRELNNHSAEKCYRKQRLYLTNGLVDFEVNTSGGYLYLVLVSALNLGVTVKLNEQGADSIPLEFKQGVKTPFSKFYVSAPASAGAYIDIVTGFYAPDYFELVDNSDDPQTLTFLQNIDENIKWLKREQVSGFSAATISTVALTLAATAYQISTSEALTVACQKIITAPLSNVDNVYIGFSNAVTNLAGFIFILAPGDTLYLPSRFHQALWGYAPTTAAQSLQYHRATII